jgi:hypothetical protein
MRVRRIALLLCLSCRAGSAELAAADPRRPVVVELFTSQGCSSCPPADAFLSDLARDRADVLPLAFHVGYWDNLGWRDPFAFEAATSRQRHYAASLRLEGVYTPQMVIDGQADLVGSDRVRALAEISRAAQAPAAAVMTVTRQGTDVLVHVGPGAGSGTIWLIGYDRQHRTFVGRGENRGRSLVESNIVQSLQQAGRWTGSTINLRLAVPGGEREAVILQADDGRIIGAARDEVPSG